LNISKNFYPLPPGLSRPVAGVLVTESAVLGVYVKRLRREKKRGAGSSS
jgi:hypothetical protein